MTMGWGGAEGWDLRPRPAWFCLTPSSSRPHDRKNFLTSSLPLETPRSPVLSSKTLLLLMCSTISTIFLMKPISLIKLYLKLQLNLSHQIKSIFRKN